ncbi:hypothetical protein [Nonomuraea recticatena]|uniref:Uncharacterized protein n=1 Tax=Nonomuraea recticatena TaxID=46178 RepID=A0ABP6DWJ4_9ACTN
MIGHAAINGTMPAFHLVVSDARHPADPVLGGLFGVVGWVVVGGIALLLTTRRWAEPA